MKNLAYASLTLTLALSAVACGPADSDIDPALVAQYRTAVPGEAQLMASAPKPSVHAKLGDPAVFPQGSSELVFGINNAVGGIIDTMKAIVDQPPSLYNSDTKEMLWGPYPNDDGFGTVAAYVREEPAGSDFKFGYALLRGVDNDIATMKPVIWGGATPDPDTKEHGVGATLWDFEANRAFEEANNPEFGKEPLEKGRFVAVYGKDADEKGGEGTFVVAAFRGFVTKDKPDEVPANLDYFYGRYNDGATTFDFLDYKGDANIDKDPAKPAAETVSVHMAFVNEGIGRAEAEASGGDLAAGEAGSAVECWDVALAQTYASLTVSTNGAPGTPVEDGMASSCGAFEKSLTELGVPSLADMDPKLLADLDEVAKNGVPAK